jgi:hypothetical protein
MDHITDEELPDVGKAAQEVRQLGGDPEIEAILRGTGRQP